jgi:hypothetical protein
LADRYERTLQFRRCIEDVRTVAHILHCVLMPECGPQTR